jgi:glycosyltransferase involved in cell wall biosynthesis
MSETDPETPQSAPRIAYLTGAYPAVSHTFILREVEALRRLGLDIVTCSIRRSGPEHLRGPAEKHAAETTFHVIATGKSPAALLAAQKPALRDPGRYFGTLARAWRMRRPGLRAALYQLFYFVEATILARHLQAEGVTHIHNHFAGPSASVAMLAARLAQIPFSFTLHGPADLAEPVHWGLGAKIAASRFVACISNYARSQAMLVSDPAHWDRLRIIHCGVDPSLYRRDRVETDDPRLHLVFVGRLAPVKGLRVLIEALLARGDRDDVRLTIVGDGTERATLEAMAAPLGEAVHFTGYQSQDEVAAILATADAFVLPSFAEGVPVVLMEALAANLPVIATRITGVPELVEDGVSGLLVSPGDADALAERHRPAGRPARPGRVHGACRPGRGGGGVRHFHRGRATRDPVPGRSRRGVAPCPGGPANALGCGRDLRFDLGHGAGAAHHERAALIGTDEARSSASPC